MAQTCVVSLLKVKTNFRIGLGKYVAISSFDKSSVECEISLIIYKPRPTFRSFTKADAAAHEAVVNGREPTQPNQSGNENAAVRWGNQVGSTPEEKKLR